MQILTNIQTGLSAALTAEALFFCFAGVTIGTFVGVLPGVGSLAALALVLPLTYHLEPLLGLIMLAGIFYGGQYGGSIASILLNLPGSATTAVTCLDGYPMAQKGEAPLALFITSITSFIGGTFGIILMMGFTPVIATVALEFGSPEFFAIMLLGLIAASTISESSAIKGFVMVGVGLALGLVGLDNGSGYLRFTFGQPELIDGISLVALAMGVFGVSEVITSVRSGANARRRTESVSFRSMLPTRAQWKRVWKPTARGSVIGSVIGALPGTGPAIASFIAYAIEKRSSKTPEIFGKGAIEGISAPEAANNAAVQAAFIPTLSLGVPGDAVMAILLGAMLVHGISPGPLMISSQPELFWGLVMSFWIGNVILLILNIPLINIWVKLLSVPYKYLYPAVLVFICVGVYSVSNSSFDIFSTLAFGVLGYLMKRYDFPAAPLLLGFILGPLIERHYIRTLQLSRGDFTAFWSTPLSLVLLAIIAVFIVSSIWLTLRKRKHLSDTGPVT